MKKLSYLIVPGLLLGLLSCGNNMEHNDSKEKADSINEARIDNPAPPAETTPIAVGEEDAKFVVDAANGCMAEVALGQLAQQKAANALVKDFGTMMVSDHTSANDELKALAGKKNITLPGNVSDEQKSVIDDMAKKSGKDFDQAYVAHMVDDHKKDIKLFETALDKVTDADLKAYIVKTLPTLKKHLSHIESIQKNMK